MAGASRSRTPRAARVAERPLAATAGLALLAVLILAMHTGLVDASSKTSKGTTKSVTNPLPTTGSATAGVKCPSKTHATGGGMAVVTGFNPATKAGTETYPQTNYPPGKAKWRAGASSLNGQPAADLSTYVRCEKNSFGMITARVSRSATLASGVARTVPVVCPAGTQVLGGGYSVSPPFDSAAKNNTTSRMAILQSRRSSASSWTVSAINPRQPTTQLTVSALCEKNGKQISTKTTFSSVPDKSRKTVTAKCAKNQHVDAGGFAVTPLFSNVGIPVIDTSGPSGSRSWQVGVYGGANIPTGSGITGYAYCKSNKPPD